MGASIIHGTVTAANHEDALAKVAKILGEWNEPGEWDITLDSGVTLVTSGAVDIRGVLFDAGFTARWHPVSDS